MTAGPFAKRARALSNMDYDEVSLVDVPANQHALVMITKNFEGADMTAPQEVAELFDMDGAPVDEDDLETGDIVQDADGETYEYTAPEDVDDREPELVGKALGRQFREGLSAGRTMGRASRSASGAGQQGRAADFIGRPSPNKRSRGARRAGARAGFYDSTTSGGRKAAHAGIAAGAAGAGGAGAYEAKERVGKSFATEIAKALGSAQSEGDRDAIIEEFAKAYDRQQDELNELANIAKSERDLRLESQYVEVAKSLGLPGDPDELGPVLKRMSDVMDPSDVEVIAKMLDSVSGVLYEEIGYDGFGPELGDPALADAEAAAEARISKAAGEKVSKAAAIEEYYVDNPTAYDEYLSSRRG